MGSRPARFETGRIAAESFWNGGQTILASPTPVDACQIADDTPPPTRVGLQVAHELKTETTIHEACACRFVRPKPRQRT